MMPATQKKVQPLFPFLDLKAQYTQVRGEIGVAVSRVLKNSTSYSALRVDQLEAELARYVGMQFAIGCASGSDALLLALMALGIAAEEVLALPVFPELTAEQHELVVNACEEFYAQHTQRETLVGKEE